MRKLVPTSSQPLKKQYFVCNSCKTRFLNDTPLFRSSRVVCPKCGSRDASQDPNTLYR